MEINLLRLILLLNEFQDNFKIEKLVLVNRLAALKVINKITYFLLHIMESHISIAVNQNIRKYDPMKFDFYYSKWKNEMSLFMLDKCIACLVVRKTVLNVCVSLNMRHFFILLYGFLKYTHISDTLAVINNL